jgi:hypothetical protein
MMARGERVKDRVFEILEAHPQARGDDLLLLYYYWRRWGKIRITFAKFEDLFQASAPETVRRRRQEIMQEHPELKPSERVKRKRARLQVAMMEHYSQKSIDTYIGMEG